jgi:hypothetical protein
MSEYVEMTCVAVWSGPKWMPCSSVSSPLAADRRLLLQLFLRAQADDGLAA